LGLLCHHQGDNDTAREYAERARQLAQEQEDPSVQGFSLICLGHALMDLASLDEARDAYERGLNVLRDVGQSLYSMDALAGLARLHLAQDDPRHALTRVEEILRFIKDHTLGGAFFTHEPFRIYLTCYRVLQANGDPCASDILEEAHRLLKAQAAKISDEAERRSFLANVAANREIVEEYAAREWETKDE
jgi:tetratricopeptide (TPR) repeat protein